MDRRNLFLMAGVAVAGFCGCDPLQANHQTTLLSVLTRLGRRITFGTRRQDGMERPFVVAIDGQEHDPNKDHYWLFYVNGIEVSEPVEAAAVEAGDVITFELVHWPLGR